MSGDEASPKNQSERSRPQTSNTSGDEVDRDVGVDVVAPAPRSLDDLQGLAGRVVGFVDVGGRQGEQVEANVTVTRTRHGLTRFANSFIHQHVGEDTVTVTLHAAVGGRVASATTTAVSDEALRDLVERTLASAAPPQEVPGTGHLDETTAEADPAARAAGVKAFVDAGPDLRAAGFLDTEANWVAFASTAGHHAAGAASRATIDGIHQTGSSAGGAHQTSYRSDELDAAAAGALAADRARRSETFVDVEPGQLEVVLGPEAVATMITFLSVYGFNAKAHLEGGSFAQLGEQQFDPGITLLEDPEDPRAIGLPFDAEGTPRRRFTLVEDGVTRSLAYDRRTALRAGTTTTGNSVPGGSSFGSLPYNPRLVTGTTSPQEMIASVEHGLLVTQFHYCRVLEPKSLVVTGLTRNGTFVIEGGEVKGAVGNLRFTQGFVTALSGGNVLAVGNDDRYASGEFGPGVVITPSLHLASWNFTGGAKG
jgi:predicted Zn-dependent protease